MEKVADLDTIMEEVTECTRTPRATLYEHNETPCGSIYWEPHVEGIPIPVEGAYYDTIDEALDMYTKYAEMTGFEIKKEGQRLTKSGAVQHKYIYCNKEGVPKAYFIDSPLYGLMRTTSRSESENSFFKSFTSPGATLVSFMMSYEFAMETQRYRQDTLDFKTIDAAPKCETKLEIKRHAARVYTRTIFLLVQMEIIKDDSLFLLSKDEGKMGAYVEKLKILLDEMKADMPNPPSRNTRDVISGIFSTTKPNQIAVQNPTKIVNKGEHLKKGERLKSEREKSLKVRKKKLRVCGFCKEKTNEHTKTTCPLNPKAKKERRHRL
uniref:Uncharacterized protein n=1 Tax=Tanacetum cinerariifolium TaxID=118510 RepID=A0A6L2M2Z6_TANCI|nr:hypothetical protein [Tanacetum cinerariifolium]